MNISRPRDTSGSRLPASWVAYAALGVATVVGAYCYGGVSTKSSTAGVAQRRESASENERLLRLEREVQRLGALAERAELARIQAQQDDARTIVPVVREEADLPTPERELSPEQQEAEAQRQEAIFYGNLDSRLTSEPVDLNWRRETEAAIGLVIPAQLGSDARLGKVECASTLCKVLLEHPNSPHIPADRMMRFAENRGPLGAYELQVNASREGMTTIYFVQPRGQSQDDTSAVGRL
jgi:hypothetical protein